MKKHLKICCDRMRREYKPHPDDGIFVDGGRLVIGYENAYGFAIDFCPFCGKKVELEDRKDEEGKKDWIRMSYLVDSWRRFVPGSKELTRFQCPNCYEFADDCPTEPKECKACGWKPEPEEE